MLERPKTSPWGEIQYSETMYAGVFSVGTAGHGGIMVKNEMAAGLLTPAAQKCGFKERGYTCFEEDTQAAVVMRELLDRKLWSIPPRVTDQAGFEERLNISLKEYNPDYWASREKSLAKAEKPPKTPDTHKNKETR